MCILCYPIRTIFQMLDVLLCQVVILLLLYLYLTPLSRPSLQPLHHRRTLLVLPLRLQTQRLRLLGVLLLYLKPVLRVGFLHRPDPLVLLLLFSVVHFLLAVEEEVPVGFFLIIKAKIFVVGWRTRAEGKIG